MASGVVRSADLKGRPARAHSGALVQHERQQAGADAAAPNGWTKGGVVDVQPVEPPPEGTKADNSGRLVSRQIAERHTDVLQFREVHFARPGAREGCRFDREDCVEV